MAAPWPEPGDGDGGAAAAAGGETGETQSSTCGAVAGVPASALDLACVVQHMTRVGIGVHHMFHSSAAWVGLRGAIAVAPLFAGKLLRMRCGRSGAAARR